MGSVWEASFSAQPWEGQVCTALFQLSTCFHKRDRATSALFSAFLASSLMAVHPFPNKNVLFWALVVKIRLVSQLLFLWLCERFILGSDIVRSPTLVVVYIITISAAMFQVRSQSSVSNKSPLFLYCIRQPSFYCSKAVYCDTIPKRKTFVKVRLVMHSYHPSKRFNWK